MNGQTPDSQPFHERTRVFISAKSSDYEQANLVYRFLADAGIPTFFSRESLPELGNADYRREIDRALDDVDHMVVVTSSLANVESPWVEAEWSAFVVEKRAGRKHGNLVTVVVGDLEAAQLPLSLRQNEVLPLTDSALKRLLRYVQGLPFQRQSTHEPRRNRVQRFREVETFGGPPRVHLMAVHPTEPIVATGGFDGGVRLYDVSARARIAVIGSKRYWAAGAEGLITALDFSRNGSRLATGHFDGTVHVWNVNGEEELNRFIKHDSAIIGLGFYSDGQCLATASGDGIARLWDLDSENESPLTFEHKPASLVSFSCLNEMLMTGLMIPTQQRSNNARIIWSSSPSFSPKDSRSRANEFEVALREPRTYQLLGQWRVEDRFTMLKLAQAGRVFAMGAGDGSVKVYEFPSETSPVARQVTDVLRPARSWQAHRKPIKTLAFFPDGGYLVSTAIDSDLLVWDLLDDKVSIRLQGASGEAFTAAELLNDGTSFVAALQDGRVRLWEII